MDIIDKTLDRVLKARVELLTTRTFYGVLLGQVTPVISNKVPTAATNGKQHYWNPEFVAKLPQDEVIGVQAHESEHDARRHHTRRGNRDPKEWNICTDYAINVDLVAQGFKLPKGALIDAKYKGMSAEDIYRSREIDRALQKQKEEEEKQKQEEQDEQDQQEQGQDDADRGSDVSEDESDEGDDGAGDESEDADDTEDDRAGDEAGDADTSESDAGSETEQAGNPDGSTEPEASQDGAGAGDSEEATDLADTSGNASGEPADEAGADENEPVSTGDPGGCGEVLDAADDTAELAGEDAKWETVLRQAAMLAAKRGEAPGHIARELEHADHPPQDWRETLRAFFDGGAATQETWSRPNRRMIGSGLYLPGRQRDGVNKAYFLIDTSGSVTYYPGALEAIKTETQAALDEGIIDEAIVIYGDTRVTRVDEYRNGDEIEFDPKGGGGTIMKPLFDYVREMADASLIVCFTDLEIEEESRLGPEPHCPVLWAVVGYPDRVKRYLANTPWGATGIEVVPSYN